MAFTPKLVKSYRGVRGQVTTAQTDKSGATTTNLVDVVTPGASGTRVFEIRCKPTGTTAAGIVTVFTKEGSTYRLIDEIEITAATSSTSVVTALSTKTYDNLVLASTQTLAFGTTITQTIGIDVMCGDY
jgi:hypothetical protein